MSNLLEYTFSLKDQASGTLQKLTGKSLEASARFEELREKTQKLHQVSKDFGGSVVSLKQKIDLLQQERDLIPAENLSKIRQYNSEIKRLGGEVERLQSVNGRNPLKNAFTAVREQIPGAELLTNPFVVGSAAVAKATTVALSFEEGMSQVNATAQLQQGELDALGKKLISYGEDSVVPLADIPVAFNKVLSAVGDTDKALQIFPATLKASEAGFVDINIAADAVTNILGAVNLSADKAEYAFDVMFRAMNAGKVEMTELASYMPKVLANTGALVNPLEQVGGAFAFLTTKGADAAQSTVLLQNGLKTLNNAASVEKLQKMGVQVIDPLTKKMRSLPDIAKDLQGQFAKFGGDAEKEMAFMGKLGLDQEAAAFFSLLAKDAEGLADAIRQTSEASGELERTYGLTGNTSNELKKAWNKLQSVALSLGKLVLPIINIGLSVFSEGLGILRDVFSGLLAFVQENQKWFILLGGALAFVVFWMKALELAAILQYVWMMRGAISTTILAAAKAKLATVTALASGAFRGLSAALAANPIGFIIGLVVALGLAVVYMWNNFEGFRGFLFGLWESVKAIFGGMLEIASDTLGGIGKLLRGIIEMDYSIVGGGLKMLDKAGKNYETLGAKVAVAYKKGFDKGVANFQAENPLEALMEKPKELETVFGKPDDPTPTSPDSPIVSGLQSVSGGGSKPVNINITLDALVQGLTIQSQSTGEGAERMREVVIEELQRVLNSANQYA